MDRYELRRLDYSLTEDHKDLQTAYRQFFKTHSPIDTVRAAEATGFDKSLWERLCAMGATTMAVSETAGGDGATLLDLTLVAEEVGRVIAPIPWIDHVCTTRLLERLGALGGDAAALVRGERIAGLDPTLDVRGDRLLIPSASIADDILIREGDDVVRLSFDTRPPKVDNIGRLPMAWVTADDAEHRVVVGTGAEAVASYQRALDEWRILMAAALAGLLEFTLMQAAEFAKTRYTLGVP